jgi:hypothetical protein
MKQLCAHARCYTLFVSGMDGLRPIFRHLPAPAVVRRLSTSCPTCARFQKRGIASHSLATRSSSAPINGLCRASLDLTLTKPSACRASSSRLAQLSRACCPPIMLAFPSPDSTVGLRICHFIRPSYKRCSSLDIAQRIVCNEKKTLDKNSHF